MQKKKSNLPWDMLLLIFAGPVIALMAWFGGSLAIFFYNFFHHH